MNKGAFTSDTALKTFLLKSERNGFCRFRGGDK